MTRDLARILADAVLIWLAMAALAMTLAAVW
jgi:hypothetical protein